MKRNLIFSLLFALSAPVFAQESMDQVKEKRGKELIRVLGINDKELWKKFIQENYTQALIDKQMRANIQGPAAESSKASEAKPASGLESKLMVYERLHNDIGKGKITSIKHNGEKMDVEVEGETGANVKFVLTFLKETPYLIDGFSVQMMMGR